MAIRVSGSAHYDRTTNLPPSTGFTAMGWFRVPSLAGWMSWIQLSGASDFYQMGVEGVTGTNKFCINKNGVENNGTTLTNGLWYHAAIVVSGTAGGAITGYLNGAVDLTGNGATFTATKLWIGNSSGGDPLNGNIAYVKVWDAVLTAAEVLQEMRQGLPFRTENLNAFYPMLSTSDDEIDFSGNARTLTVTGTPTVENGPPVPWRMGRRRFVYVPSAGGGDTATPSPAISTWTANSPTISVGDATATPLPASSTWTAKAPTISLGGITASPSSAIATWTANGPTISVGGVTASPSAAISTWTANTASIAVGGITASPSPAVATWTANNASVSIGGGATASPSPASSTWNVPAAFGGTGDLSTPSAAVSTWVANGPSVTVGGIAVAPSPAITTWNSQAPTVGVGGITAAPSAAVSAWVALAASVGGLIELGPRPFSLAARGMHTTLDARSTHTSLAARGAHTSLRNQE